MIDKGVIPKSPSGVREIHQDPLKVQQAIIEINAHKSSAADRLLEYWYNAVLSAPTTHVKNVTGNVINGGRMAAVGFTKLISEVATLQKTGACRFGTRGVLVGFWGGLMPGGEKLHDGLEYRTLGTRSQRSAATSDRRRWNGRKASRRSPARSAG